MGIETHKFREKGVTKVFTTCNDFWECECPKAFYHVYTERECLVCKSQRDSSADARPDEMLTRLNAETTKTSQAFIHNIANMTATAIDELAALRANTTALGEEAQSWMNDLEGSLKAIAGEAADHGWE